MSFFYVYFQTKKRVRQDLSQAQTVNAGLLLDTAEYKNDESILLHIRDIDMKEVLKHTLHPFPSPLSLYDTLSLHHCHCMTEAWSKLRN